MRKTSVLILIIGIFCHLVSAQENSARIPIENYLQGQATGKGEFYQKAFHPESSLVYVRDGKFNKLNIDRFIAGASGKPADDESSRKRTIEFIQVVGNAAIAKVILDYPNAYFVDYLALLKIGDEWKIVNESFHEQPRTKTTKKISFKITEKEKKAIAVPLNNYFKSGATGEGKFFLQAFHPEGKIMSISNGKFNQTSAQEYASLFTGKPDDTDPVPKLSFEILDVAGNAAIAKAILDFPKVRFTDFLSLLKIKGEWKIINKISATEAKSAINKI